MSLSQLRTEAIVHHQANRLDEAAALFAQVLQAAPRDPDALYGLGIIAYQRGDLRLSVKVLGDAINALPTEANLWARRGLVLMKLGAHEDALVHYDQALRLKPGHLEVLNNRALALKHLGRFVDAVAAFDKALALKPDFAEAWLNRANALEGIGQTAQAIVSVNRAIALRPDYGEAYFNRGNFETTQRDYEAAHRSFEAALRHHAPSESALGAWVHAKMHLCDWAGLSEALDKLRDGLAADRRLTGAFPTLGLFDDPALQKQANVMQAAHFSRTFVTRLPPPSPRRRRDKIRVGYFSADFHSHPMMHLMAELFEVHDKSRFEILAFSNGPDTDDPWRRRVRASFDAFHEIAAKSDREVVELARRLELDLAIDLSGFTGGCRPGVFLARAAPIQINYLGYPSTTALPTMDYLIADATVIPDDKRPFYTERVLWLPHCYQVNCQTREVAESPVTRADFGLPEEAFVFCSFNSQYKITPPMFDAWMRILAKVPDSVLWLLVKGDVARANIRRETEARGLDPARVVFADHLPVERHLQRIPLADLKLDSTPYGAHTTGSDCLRMGVPMVTLLGDAFAARVGASLLNAVGLPELITTDLAQYEALAVELATDALAAREDGTPTSRLSALRAKLEAHAKASPLFDTVATARALEGHFSEIVARYDEAHAARTGDPDAR